VTPPNIVRDCCPQCGGALPPTSGERIVCDYCGSSLIRGAAAKADRREVWGVRFKRVSCIDHQGTGSEAFDLLIPAEWVFEGGVHWQMDNPGMPAVIAFQVRNPNGAEAFEAFPNLPFYWTNNPMITMSFPVGTVYYGNELRPPGSALDVLREIVVPRFRSHFASVEIVDEEHLPGLAQEMQATSPVAPTGITSADGGRVRIRYQHGDQTVDEDVFGVVEISHHAGPMLMGGVNHIYWMADYLFSFRAGAGQLDRLSDIFTSILRSFHLNPAWYSRYTQVSQYMVQNQIQQIRHIGQISQIVSRTSDHIDDIIMNAYDKRQRTLDRLSNQFSQAIRGVDEYSDPLAGRSVELPGGYRQAWSNGLGDYIVSDDATFDPNVGSTVTWEPLKRH